MLFFCFMYGWKVVMKLVGDGVVVLGSCLFLFMCLYSCLGVILILFFRDLLLNIMYNGIILILWVLI